MKKLYIGTQDDPADRTVIVINAEDARRVDALLSVKADLVAEVTDVRTGERHRLKRAACGLGRMCAVDFAGGSA